MYDNISAEQWIYGLLACLIAFGVMWWLFFHYTRPRDMSTSDDAPAAKKAVSDPVAATSTNDGQRIATPGNADNAELSGNAVADPIPSEARDIIRMQARAEAVVALLKSAKMTNKAEAIELIFNCSRSGRPNSTYQQAVALVDALIDRYPQRTPEQEQSRAELGLSVR
jgi:hypothetical protein